MSVQAYILIQSEIGSSEAVVLATRAVPGVIEAYEVTGPYDVIDALCAATHDDVIRSRHLVGLDHSWYRTSGKHDRFT